MGNNSNGFRPINASMGSNSSGTNGGKSSKYSMIIFIIVLVIYLYGASNNENSNYDDNTGTDIASTSSSWYTEDAYEGYDYRPNSYDSSSTNNSIFDLIFGGDVSSNTDYASFEDPTIRNSSSAKYTFLVYMCGSNLESDGGYASYDIEEMLKATLADEINLLIYTGGAKRWYDFGISSNTNQIYKVENHRLNLVKDNVGSKSMAESSTLLEFLNFAKTNYPADKYSLIFWDHGGGAVSGFGLDEKNAKRDDTLTIDEIKTAITSSKLNFEFVGFDACLMANVETAYALKDSSKYMVASEETEPGTGWDYIKVLNTLSTNTAQSGSTTGKTIVDSFIASNSSYRNPDATLSVVDLSKLDGLYLSLVNFMKDVKANLFAKSKYNSFSKGIKLSKAFGEGSIDTIDLIHFASVINNKESNSLVKSAQDAIVYNKTNQYVDNSYGLSIYIPYKNLKYYDKMLSIYKNIGMGAEYTNVITEYVNLIAGGRKETYTVNNYSYTQDAYNYTLFDWFDASFIKANKNYYNQTALDTQELKVEDKGDYFALHLSADDWEKITKVESVVWYDTGKGYLNMGVDSYFELDSEGDLEVSFDGNWIAINGDNVKYEVIETTSNYEKGKVPAVINDTRVNLILYFDKSNPDGIVLGYEPDYEELEMTLYEKGLRKLKQGDKIDFVCDYYDYDGLLDDEYYINDTIVVGKEPLNISYEWLGDNECLIYYRLTDIYNNAYYTEPVIVE